jgi:hypothetical protein
MPLGVFGAMNENRCNARTPSILEKVGTGNTSMHVAITVAPPRSIEDVF